MTAHDLICERYAILLDPNIVRNDTERNRYNLAQAKIAVEQSFFLRNPTDAPLTPRM